MAGRNTVAVVTKLVVFLGTPVLIDLPILLHVFPWLLSKGLARRGMYQQSGGKWPE